MYTVTTSRFAREQETRTFTTAMGLLRWALNERVFAHRVGGRPYPTLDCLHLGHRDNSPGYDYHLVDTFAQWQITGDHLAAMRRALRRYREIVRHQREIAPGWVEDRQEWPADNSRYRIDRCTAHDGQHTRRVMLAAPSGDACF